jgi:acetyltransferase-like isoleucine patch superfamily enzyme
LIKRTPWWRSLLPLHHALQGNDRKIDGKNNVIQIDHTEALPFLKQVKISISGHHNTLIIERGVHLRQTNIDIRGSHNIIRIAETCQISGSCLWIADDRCSLNIGKETTIAEASIGIAELGASISIGDDCMLSHGIDIRCGDSHAILDLETRQRLNQARGIQIDHHVWLGMRSCILKDVHIGHDAIIAAGSIVTKNIPPHAIAAGVPATVKKTNVTWSREKTSITA